MEAEVGLVCGRDAARCGVKRVRSGCSAARWQDLRHAHHDGEVVVPLQLQQRLHVAVPASRVEGGRLDACEQRGARCACPGCDHCSARDVVGDVGEVGLDGEVGWRRGR